MAVQSCIPSKKFAQLAFGDEPQVQMRRALRFWTVLLEDDSVSDAVTLEAYIAAANAFFELGDQQRAQSSYRHAVALSEQALAKVERTAQSLRNHAQLIALASGDWTVPVDSQPSVLVWLAQSDTHNMLSTITDCQRLSAQLTAVSTPLAGTKIAVELAGLRGRVDALKKRALSQTTAAAMLIFKRERKDLQRYKLHALLELSQVQQPVGFSKP